MKEPAIDEKT